VPRDYDVSSAMPCFFIHVTYAMYRLYIRALSVMLSRISFPVLIRQKNDGILLVKINMLLKFLKNGFTKVKTASTPMETQKPLLKDEDGKEVDVHMYRSMIGSLMYLTSSRPDIMFAVCACARYQVNTKLWSTAMTKTINGEVQLHAQLDGKEIVITESSVRRDLQLADEKDEAVHKELGDSLVKAATTASSLEAEQDSGNKTKTQFKATSNEPSSQGTNSGGGPSDSVLVRGNTFQSDKNSMKVDELMALCTTLQNKVLDLEKTKTTQRNEINSLKRSVKKLEKRNMSRTHKLKRLYKVGLSARVESSRDEESLGEDASKQERRIDAIDADEDITLVNDAGKEMFDADDLGGEEVFVTWKNKNVVEEVVNAAQVITGATTVTITTKEITLAQALEALKTLKPKVKGIAFQESGKSTTTTISSQQSQDNGKEIMIEEPVKPKKKDQIRLDEEAAKKLQGGFDEEERLTRERAEKEQEDNIALIETRDDI
nr:hypothetical protein [Tanacetum cinerariifolium]